MHRAFTLICAFLGMSLLTSCVRDDYYNVPPAVPQPVTIFNDDFNNDNFGWSFNDNYNDAHIAIFDGLLKYTFYPGAPGVHTAALPSGGNLRHSFILFTSLKTNNAAALLFGTGGDHYGYTLFIDADGNYALYDEGDDEWGPEPVIDWPYSNALNKGGWNDIELEQLDGYWTAWVNGTQLFSIPAEPLYGDGIGFMVLDGTTAYADYLTLKQ